MNLVTTEIILIEFLNYFCSYKSTMRQTAVNIVRIILEDTTVEVVPYTHKIFLAGLALYEQRLDKGYSMVDCISMIVMQNLSITDILTNDKHFTQEGFKILL